MFEIAAIRMQKRTPKENLAQYETRLSRVMEFINHNLDEDLCLEELSQVATLSKYHFHRVFHAYIGTCLLYTSPSPRDQRGSRMPSSA